MSFQNKGLKGHTGMFLKARKIVSLLCFIDVCLCLFLEYISSPYPVSMAVSASAVTSPSKYPKQALARILFYPSRSCYMHYLTYHHV